MKAKPALLIARIFIGIVTFFNLQCAVVFLISPARYASAFEISGIPGSAFVSALGILFLMWNVPYLFALSHPVRYRISLIQAVIMQTIGLIGETLLYRNIPLSHTVLRQSTLRFIIFDGGGLLLLLAALWLVHRLPKDLPAILHRGDDGT
ncbi:MAG: hypothetical protein RBT34_06765 [Anaerolineaceae bacterium]|jgi:hypothetical protein|nr:hypothetical protein [Anaerolineaceae bacterium]